MASHLSSWCTWVWIWQSDCRGRCYPVPHALGSSTSTTTFSLLIRIQLLLDHLIACHSLFGPLHFWTSVFQSADWQTPIRLLSEEVTWKLCYSYGFSVANYGGLPLTFIFHRLSYCCTIFCLRYFNTSRQIHRPNSRWLLHSSETDDFFHMMNAASEYFRCGILGHYEQPFAFSINCRYYHLY